MLNKLFPSPNKDLRQVRVGSPAYHRSNTIEQMRVRILQEQKGQKVTPVYPEAVHTYIATT